MIFWVDSYGFLATLSYYWSIWFKTTSHNWFKAFTFPLMVGSVVWGMCNGDLLTICCSILFLTLLHRRGTSGILSPFLFWVLLRECWGWQEEEDRGISYLTAMAELHSLVVEHPSLGNSTWPQMLSMCQGSKWLSCGLYLWVFQGHSRSLCLHISLFF